MVYRWDFCAWCGWGLFNGFIVLSNLFTNKQVKRCHTIMDVVVVSVQPNQQHWLVHINTIHMQTRGTAWWHSSLTWPIDTRTSVAPASLRNYGKVSWQQLMIVKPLNWYLLPLLTCKTILCTATDVLAFSYTCMERWMLCAVPLVCMCIVFMCTNQCCWPVRWPPLHPLLCDIFSLACL